MIGKVEEKIKSDQFNNCIIRLDFKDSEKSSG